MYYTQHKTPHTMRQAPALAPTLRERYCKAVTAKSVTGRGNPNPKRRTSAPISAGAFFVPAACYGGCAWDTFGCAGFLFGRFSTPRTVATQSRGKDRGDSNQKGVIPMASFRLFPTRSAPARAAAHRAMAKAALFSNSSAAVRLKRYNHHMDKARRLEAAPCSKAGAA